ncbi:MAG: DUF4249 family protein [Bacteroidota bacterium]
MSSTVWFRWCWYIIPATLLCMYTSCSTEFEVFAPEEPIWVVYGVLNPDSTQQDIRISRGFQLEGDAIEFSGTHDPSASGLTVWLEEGTKRYDARWIDSIVKTDTLGAFGPTLGLYRISTPEGLIPGFTYTLHIRSEQDTSLRLSAYTHIPPRPQLLNPRIINRTNEHCLPEVYFEDSTEVIFLRHASTDPHKAMRYELRVRMRYIENGIPKEFIAGPTPLFANNEACALDRRHTLCYLFEKGWMIRSLQNAFRNTSYVYELNTEPTCASIASHLSNALTLEVVAVDSFLSAYMIANDPRTLNLNDYRIEYTNIKGSQQGIGILGSICADQTPFSLSPCGLQLLGLQPVQPGICD